MTDLSFAQNRNTLRKDQSRPDRGAPSETGRDQVIELNRISPKSSLRGAETDFQPLPSLLSVLWFGLN